MVVLAVTWFAKDGQQEKAAEVFRRLTEASRKEPGCLMYLVHRHKDESRGFLIYEQYKDDAALEAHRNTPHFEKMVRGELTQYAERREAALYTPLE